VELIRQKVMAVALQSCQYKKARESDVHGPTDELLPVLSDRCPVTKLAASNYSRKKSRQDRRGQKQGYVVQQVLGCSGKCTSTCNDTGIQSRGMAGQDFTKVYPRTDLRYSRGV
jgi:hypothetical protein